VILFDAALELSAGVVFAARDRVSIVATSHVLSLPGFRRGLLVSAFTYVPGVVFFVTRWPRWSAHQLLEMKDPGEIALFLTADVVLMFALYVGGYLAGVRSVRRGTLRRALAGLCVLWGVVLVLSFGIAPERSFAGTSGPFWVAMAASWVVNGSALVLAYVTGSRTA
jgi:hypothetical protein